MSDNVPLTRQSTISHVVPCAVYDFTFFVTSETESVDAFVAMIRPLFKKWCFQLERCPTTGSLHYQGRGSLFKKRRQPEACSLVNSTPLRGMDLTESSNESQKGESFYTLKYETRISGPWDDRTYKSSEPDYVPIQYRGIMTRLHPFQRTIMDFVDDYRSVNIVIHPEGNAGKSTVAHLCRLFKNGIRLPAIGDHKELIQVACNILMGRQERHPGPIFVDLPRALLHDPKRLAPFFIAIEEIKGGYVYDVRNHYKEWDFDSPPIWVFCNSQPEWASLSMDRWRKWWINEQKELVRGTHPQFRRDANHHPEDHFLYSDVPIVPVSGNL